MKLKIIFLILTLLVINSNADFLKGVDLYKEGEYKSAIEEFSNIEDPNEYINYNIGNCYYRIGNNVKAVFYYLKALKINPGLIEAQNNLIAITGAKKMLHWYFIPFNVNKIYLTGNLILFVLIIIAFFIKYFKKRYRAYLYVLCTFFLFIAVYSISVYFFFDNYNPVVLIENSSILSSPSEKSVNISDFSKASFAFILDESKNYYKITDMQGISGWIKKEQVKNIK